MKVDGIRYTVYGVSFTADHSTVPKLPLRGSIFLKMKHQPNPAPDGAVSNDMMINSPFIKTIADSCTSASILSCEISPSLCSAVYIIHEQNPRVSLRFTQG